MFDLLILFVGFPALGAVAGLLGPEFHNTRFAAIAFLAGRSRVAINLELRNGRLYFTGTHRGFLKNCVFRDSPATIVVA